MAEQVRTARHRAAVIGSPVAHSLSPVLHQAAYRSLGLEDWDYERIELGAQDLPAMLARVRAAAGPGQDTWAGLSVTMPHKQSLIGLLDVVEPLAVTVGSVNTVVAQRSGAGEALLAGFNTDVAGIVGALRDTAPDLVGPPAAAPGPAGTCPAGPDMVSAPPRRALVLGSGATACSALAALTELGATTITVAARRHAGPGRAMAAAHRMGLEPRALTWQPGLPASDAEVAQELALAELVVSTLPAGAADALARPLTTLLARPQETGRERVLLDVVYQPWPTALARAWARAGGRVAPGWLMLLHQAVPQVRLMTGSTAPIGPMRRALEAALTHR